MNNSDLEKYEKEYKKIRKKTENFGRVEFINEIIKLKRENKLLKNKINKAIEKLDFIDEALKNESLNIFLCIVKITNTLKILEKSDK